MNKPEINVTPLIDVLLVLLIIFMVVAPLKPSSFKTRVPAEPTNLKNVRDNPQTLAIIIGADASLKLNAEAGMGTATNPEPLIARLKNVFDQRIATGYVSESFADDPERPIRDRIERTVFIKAPRHLDYGSVARIVDAAKLAGAFPITLQVDNLD